MQKIFPPLLLALLVYACSSMMKVEESNGIETSSDRSTKSSVDKTSLTRQTLIQEAKKLTGSKYKYGGTSPKGFDCSGFTSYVYNKAGMDIPRSSSAQAGKGTKITQGAAQPGDLLFFRFKKKDNISHVAMVLSNDKDGMQIIHSTTSKGVMIEDISTSKYWQEKLLFGRRYVE